MTPQSPESRQDGSERDRQQSQQEPSRDAPMMASPPKGTPKLPCPAGGSRPRWASKKPEPTLLTDFLKGRPSPARIAAERRKRQSLEAVKADLRHEMKQGSVRRLQPPSGIHARVQAWQATNGSAMAHADPNDAASEPTEVAFKDDVDSVTEEDRVRIKLRQSKPTKQASPSPTRATAPDDHARLNSPPKKRVVSDDNWRKRNKAKHPLPRNLSPKSKQPPSHAPNDAVDKPAPDPTVSQKVKSWAAQVEVSETPSSDTEETSSQETAKNAPQSARRADHGIRVTPLAIKHNDSSRIARHRKSKSADGGRAKDTAKRLVSPKSNDQPRPSWSRDWTRPDARTGNPLKTVPHAKSTRGRTENLVPPNDQDSDAIEIVEYAESDLQTPPKPSSKSMRKSKSNTESPRSQSHKPTEAASSLDSPPHQDSDLASSLANRSVADIPGEIPFGHSAFSELDLSLNKSRPRRVKPERNSNLNVFKKVVEEGKKIIHDINETQKQPVPNKPPSIEKWLNSTVEPFAENPKEPSLASEKQQQQQQQHGETSTRRRSYSPTRAARATTSTTTSSHGEYKVDGQEIETSSDGKAGRREAESPKDIKSAQVGGLRRARATRSCTSSPKSSSRSQLLGVLKEAFQGESSGHVTQPKSYQSQEERQYGDGHGQSRDSARGRRSDGHGGSERAPASHRSSLHNSHSHSSHSQSSHSQSSHSQSNHSQSNHSQSSLHTAGPRFKPPTSGRHELSTIASEDNCSTVESDLSSDATRTTLTQSTACTKDSEAGKERHHGPGLKRRLTRHSDLVSVLSLPDNTSIPSGIKDRRTRPSLRKTRNSSDDVTTEELLGEFADDENLYLRELRTLVDGVVPVLLSHGVAGTQASDLFGQGPSVPKSVVDMGVALEKLKNAHKKAPTGDLGKLSNWAHGVVPIYHNYLRAWRLGFEDVVVNLAPAADSCPDNDSLLNALPRNDKGDIVNRHGERVAVAHLLKRPLVRVKQMNRFFKCVDAMMGSNDTRDLVQDFDDLQEKTRQRHREEVARITDQDAADTDASKTRELRTLDALGGVTIDGSLQVNAKDLFSLSLSHSNGQRLECQAELVHRDNSKKPEYLGDLLIRETGHGSRTYLLFEPIPMDLVSARAGKDKLDLVVMVRGTHGGEPWYQLLDLVSESPDQVQDWLEILPSSPVPPEARQADQARQQKHVEATASPESPKPPIDNDLTATVADCKTPCRSKRASLPSKLSWSGFAEAEQDKSERSRPLSESMRPDPSSLMRDTSAKDSPEDHGVQPPRPPVHSSPSAGSAVSKLKPKLQAPSESKDEGKLKRRGSSPLKHEYLPSDASSTDDEYSSDDDMDSSDIPQTELGLSIQKEQQQPVQALASSSDCSLAPSNSASQAGLAKADRFIASISRWSDQGVWADLAPLPCSII
ncbi:hypothetical protein CDD82_5722 [Ophiocordyceps australis]|uniref:DH domain-containing protein n=1 Tax=Ophiocordyceps australis TaxID=1399860 RepID=A0A2C5YZM4_9HYPO|nr:hypothetical protein CDD82_5722 [Ophiocordyceps australis]